MATWVNGVRAAQSLIENVEECMQGYGYYLHVSLYPYRTSSGQSNGVSAVFENRTPEGNKYICISVYEHWGTDNLCLKVDNWVPTSITGMQYDIPGVEFRENSLQVQEVAYGIQSFLCQFFDLPYPNEWDVPLGFQGNGHFEDEDRMDYVDDTMMPLIMDWCDPPKERENG